MAKINKFCSIEQAFNFKQDVKAPVGHLLSLKIGSKEFYNDIELINPINNQVEKVVGPISGISWEGGKANPIINELNVSIKNKQLVSELVFSDLSNIAVEFSFVIYDYDPVKKVYYPCFHVEDNLLGIINRSHNELAINISDYPASEITSPENYALTLEVIPQPEQQILEIAFSQTAKMAKEWGVATL